MESGMPGSAGMFSITVCVSTAITPAQHKRHVCVFNGTSPTHYRSAWCCAITHEQCQRLDKKATPAVWSFLHSHTASWSKCGASTPALSICTALQHDCAQVAHGHLSCCIPYTDKISWVTACITSLDDIEACGHVILKPQQTGATSHVVS